MVFSSTIFLFLFLPVVLTGYALMMGSSVFGCSRRVLLRAANGLLLAASLFFYAWGEQLLVLVMITSTLVDYVCGRVIASDFGDALPGLGRTPRQKAALVASIAANLGFLGFFKYFNFGIDNLNAAFAGLGLDRWVWTDPLRIALPIGISFYTFQSMSYTIDVYRGDVKATRNLLDFATFVTLFPQLVAGPIVRYRDLADSLADRRVTRADFAAGLRRFTVGLGKKVLIANTLALPADRIFALEAGDLSGTLAWFGVVCYTLQIYFDFSGYSDMAIGLGRLFGFRFPENFNYPYIAGSIRAFWRRWHISLSTWFRDYLYIPLGGNRSGRLRGYINLGLVFLLCGLWHGASWTFVLWGLYHGLFLVFERMGLEALLARRAPRAVRHVYALLVIVVGWVIFRSETFGQAAAVLRAMAGFAQPTGYAAPLGLYLSRDVAAALLAGLLFAMPVVPAVVARLTRDAAAGRLQQTAGAALQTAGLALILLACAVRLAAGTHNPFIYFRF